MVDSNSSFCDYDYYRSIRLTFVTDLECTIRTRSNFLASFITVFDLAVLSNTFVVMI
jgi:hypothetical protein